MSYYDKADLIYLMSGAAGKGGNGTGKVYSLKGDTDIAYNRGADLGATRIDKDGLIEKGRENLFTHSNEFSNNSSWSKNNLSVSASGDAFDVTDDTSTGSHYLFFSGTTPNSTALTASIEAKAGSVNFLCIRLGGFDYAFFNVSNGQKGTIPAGYVDSKIEATSDGFYRCSVSIVTPASSSAAVFFPANSSSSISYTGTNSVALTVRNAQLERGLVATNYITSGASTGKAGVLVDEPRFNKITHSEYFGAWNPTDVTVENNSIISPEGVKNAAKLVIDNGVSSNAEIRVNGVPVLNATSYTFSLFAKAGGFDQVQLDVSDARFGNAHVTATLTGSGSVASGGGSTDAYIEQLKDGWYRIVLVGTTTSAGNTALMLRLQVSGINGTGDGSKGIYVYGAQFEHGVHVGGSDDGNEIDAKYPTSYIPTHGAAVTRDQDGHTNPTLVNTNADQFSFFAHTSQGESVNSNRGPRLYHSTTDGTKDATCGYFVSNVEKVFFFDSNAGSGTDRNISKTLSTASNQDHADVKYLFCTDNIELRTRLFVDGVLFADTARPTTSGGTVRAMTERADFDRLRLTSSADVGEPDELTSVITFDSSLSNTEGKILTGATNYVSFGAMVDALTNYTTYE